MDGSEAAAQEVATAWTEFADQLRLAGERVGALVADLAPLERADGYRALLRATNNQLGRLEVDRERPELVAFNGWREKFLMDNPDVRYWVADVHDDRRYRIVGSMAGAVYCSITAYSSSGVLDAAASTRIDSDALPVGDDGIFELTLARDATGDGPWLALAEGTRSVWVRMFFDGPDGADTAWCRIEPLDPVAAPAPIEPERFAQQLRRAGATVARWPTLVRAAAAADLAAPNTIRHWSEMTGGAAFTEPGIHYLRGSWELDADEALVVDGPLPDCRYWSVLLYSRFLNSLDHRHRRVSRTAATSTVVDGRYRYVLSAHDPSPGSVDGPGGDPVGDWLDTEGRQFGIVVLRFLHSRQPPELPTVRRVTTGGGPS
jgi:hypothetical protein